MHERLALNDSRIAQPSAQAICGICDGILTRHGHAYIDGHNGHVYEGWKCRNCGTEGAVVRDSNNGHPLRLGHTMTGNGTVYND